MAGPGKGAAEQQLLELRTIPRLKGTTPAHHLKEDDANRPAVCAASLVRLRRSRGVAKCSVESARTDAEVHTVCWAALAWYADGKSTSGAEYRGVPTGLEDLPKLVTDAERPKSASFTRTPSGALPSDDLAAAKRMFSGFKSLCTTFLRWQYCTPATTW